MIKAFNDGNRFCLVFENCSDQQKQDLIRQYNPQLVGDLEAEMMDDKKQETVKKENNTKNNRIKSMVSFLSQSSVPNESTDQAFKELAYAVTSRQITRENAKIVADTLNNYLILRFSNIDPNAFVGLSPKQHHMFFETFGAAITNSIWQKTGINGYEDFIRRPQQDKDMFMKEVIYFFKGFKR